jgi:cytidylate kinase
VNLVISGWPGGGTTTLSILLSYALKLKLYRGSSTFRLLGEKLKFGDTGKDRIDADSELEPVFGPIYDRYNKYVLENRDSILVETDYHIADRKKNPKIIAYFLCTSVSVRAGRLSIDSRENDVDLIQERDSLLRQKYKDLFGIDWFDKKDLKRQYNVLIDNDNATISEELEVIYRDLMRKGYISVDEYKILVMHMNDLESLFWTNGKQYLLDLLDRESLLYKGEDILKEINQLFRTEILNMPTNIREAILSFA